MQTEEKIYVEPVPLSDETILESFKKFIEKDDSDERLLAFLAKESEIVLRKRTLRGLTTEDEKELAEFYQCFTEHYGEQTEELMLRLCVKEETLVLWLGEVFYHTEYERKAIEQIMNSTRQEAETLFVILSRYFYGNRKICFQFSVPYDDWGLSISGRMSNRQRAEFKRCCITSFINVILYSGTMIVLIMNQHTKSKKLIGIRGNGITWLPVSKDEMPQESACMLYRRLHMDRLVEYIEISKEQ